MARKLRWKRMEQARRRGKLKPEHDQTRGGPVKTYTATPEQIAELLAKPRSTRGGAAYLPPVGPKPTFFGHDP